MIVQTFQRTVTNVGASATSYKAIVRAPEGSTVIVSPEILVFGKAYEKQSYSLTIHYMGNKNGTVTFGSLVWVEQNEKHMGRSPIAMSPVIKVW